MVPALLYLLPPLLLIAALALRRYPGERRLAALAGRRKPRRLERPLLRVHGGARPRTLVPRGGDLIAASLANRPPPSPVLH